MDTTVSNRYWKSFQDKVYIHLTPSEENFEKVITLATSDEILEMEELLYIEISHIRHISQNLFEVTYYLEDLEDTYVSDDITGEALIPTRLIQIVADFALKFKLTTTISRYNLDTCFFLFTGFSSTDTLSLFYQTLNNYCLGTVLVSLTERHLAYYMSRLVNIHIDHQPEGLRVRSPIYNQLELETLLEANRSIEFKTLPHNGNPLYIQQILELWNAKYATDQGIVWYSIEYSFVCLEYGRTLPQVMARYVVKSNQDLYRFGIGYRGIFSEKYVFKRPRLIKFKVITPEQYQQFLDQCADVDVPDQVYRLDTRSLSTARKFHLQYPSEPILVRGDQYILLSSQPIVDLPDRLLIDFLNLSPRDGIIDWISQERYEDLSLEDFRTGMIINRMFYRPEELAQIYYDPQTREPIDPQTHTDAEVAPCNHLGMGLIPRSFRSNNIRRQIYPIYVDRFGSSIVTIFTENCILSLETPTWIVEHGLLGQMFDVGLLSDPYVTAYINRFQTILSYALSDEYFQLRNTNPTTVRWYLQQVDMNQSE